MGERKPYGPSNGSEGDWFMSLWCFRCEKDRRSDRPCKIVGRAMAFSIGDPEYPSEWICDNDGPRCTAFVALGSIPYKPPSPTIRDKRQIDMFAPISAQGGADA